MIQSQDILWIIIGKENEEKLGVSYIHMYEHA